MSAGLLMCRTEAGRREFFLVHPGGPFFRNRDEGVWSIPKGLANDDEDMLSCGIREFTEETGITPAAPFYPLGSVRMKTGKVIHAWAFLGDWDEQNGIVSNTFTIEWPPHSKRMVAFPEADRARWVTSDEAIRLIHPAQIIFLERANDSPVFR